MIKREPLDWKIVRRKFRINFNVHKIEHFSKYLENVVLSCEFM